jgi:WD40 repeat protein/serine/threonine protein kinase
MDPSPPLHPTDEALASYGLGKIRGALADSVDRHLEECVACRQRVAELSSDSFLDRLRQAHAQPEVDWGQLATHVPVDPPDAAQGSQVQHPPANPELSARSVPPELVSHPQWQVERELGHGGMGRVFLARNRLMDRLEVLKVLKDERLARPGADDRFQREIKSAARLDHPNVVRAYTASRIEDLLIFAMEYVKGDDLAKLVCEQGPLPAAIACRFGFQTAQGLQHAHECGMVHRDIKPGNLILLHKDQKTVKILDFGLAKFRGRDIRPDDSRSDRESDPTLTHEGQILGTPDFIAPEQTLDAPQADARSDIYSLGCTLYFLITGHPPLRAHSVFALFAAHREVEPVPLNVARPEVPPELAAVVAKMMAKDPSSRYQTASAVAQALKPFCEPEASIGADAKSPQSAPRPNRPNGVIRTATPGDGIDPALAPPDGPALADTVKGLAETTRDRGSPHDQSTRRAQGPSLRAAIWVIVVVLALGAAIGLGREKLKGWLGLTQPKSETPNPANGSEDVLIFRPVQPTVIGNRPNRWVGFPQEAVQTVFDGKLPRILVPQSVAAAGPLVITRLFLCRRAMVPLPETPNRLGARELNLWVPGKAGPCARVVPAAGGQTGLLEPSQPLADGVYCCHSGILSNLKPPPDFCCPFIVRGYGVPEVEKTAVQVGPTEVKLTVLVRNSGRGEFDGGFLDVALQPAGRRAVYSPTRDSQRVPMAPIPASGQRQIELLWNVAGREPGKYSFQGHIDDEELQHRVSLVGFRTPPFDIGGSVKSRSVNGNPRTGPALARGVWAVEQNELVQSSLAQGENASPTLILGDDWSDYDLSLQFKKTLGVGSVAFQFHWLNPGHYCAFRMGVSNNQKDDFGCVDAGHWRQNSANSKAGGLALDRWYAVKIEVRSGASRCFVDDKLQFVQSEPKFTHGQIHIRLWGVAARFRQIKVTDPQGKVLWEGLPPLPPDLGPEVLSEAGNEIFALTGHTGRLAGVAFSPDGKQIVSGGKDTLLKVWDAESGRELRTIEGNGHPVYGVAYSPDGKRIASGTSSVKKTIIVWDAQSGQERLALEGHRGTVLCVAYSPDGKQIASGSDDKTIKLWDADTGHEIRTLKGHGAKVWGVAFRPDGKRIATASADDTVIVWDALGGQRMLTLKGHTAPVLSVAFSPDGKRIASASWDRTLKLWDADSGRELFNLAGHEAEVLSVAYSPDGKWIASGSADEHLKLWDPSNGRPQLTLIGHTAPVTSLAFRPDGLRIASGSWDATVRIWAPPGAISYSIQNMRVEILRPGLGTKIAAAGNLLAVNYIVKSADGKKLHSTYDKGNRPLTFKLGSDPSPKGCELGIPGMRWGEIRRLTIPPELAHASGSFAVAGIPENATLIYEIELLAIHNAGSRQAKTKR